MGTLQPLHPHVLAAVHGGAVRLLSLPQFVLRYGRAVFRFVQSGPDEARRCALTRVERLADEAPVLPLTVVFKGADDPSGIGREGVFLAGTGHADGLVELAGTLGVRDVWSTTAGDLLDEPPETGEPGEEDTEPTAIAALLGAALIAVRDAGRPEEERPEQQRLGGVLELYLNAQPERPMLIGTWGLTYLL